MHACAFWGQRRDARGYSICGCVHVCTRAGLCGRAHCCAHTIMQACAQMARVRRWGFRPVGAVEQRVLRSPLRGIPGGGLLLGLFFRGQGL